MGCGCPKDVPLVFQSMREPARCSVQPALLETAPTVSGPEASGDVSEYIRCFGLPGNAVAGEGRGILLADKLKCDFEEKVRIGCVKRDRWTRRGVAFAILDNRYEARCGR